MDGGSGGRSSARGSADGLSGAVLDSVAALLVGVDEAGTVVLFNRAASALTGWSLEEVRGRAVPALLAEEPEAARGMASAVAAAAKGEERELTATLRTKGGEERSVRWHVTPLHANGRASVLLAGTDLTERTELERRAAEAEAMAAMGRLTTSLAHEIKNPLNSAILQLELVRRAAARLEVATEGASMSDPLERVRSELGRLSRLLDDFMGLARPQQLALRPTDLPPLVRAASDLLRHRARETGTELVVEVGEVPRVLADEGRITQALMDLAGNALDAVHDRPDGHVWIRVRPEGAGAALVVEDDGLGLPEPFDVLRRPFVTTKPSGTGLGLPIVSQIAELHGGSLSIGPRPGGGTIATLLLPAGPASVPAGAP